ncbi:hypothetical protein GGS20DRAFT_590995 [Poronia punctata]|nr:hypothetical protein GGS20DRAFT_590995 [Poronia punctata]
MSTSIISDKQVKGAPVKNTRETIDTKASCPPRLDEGFEKLEDFLSGSQLLMDPAEWDASQVQLQHDEHMTTNDDEEEETSDEDMDDSEDDDDVACFDFQMDSDVDGDDDDEDDDDDDEKDGLARSATGPSCSQCGERFTLSALMNGQPCRVCYSF